MPECLTAPSTYPSMCPKTDGGAFQQVLHSHPHVAVADAHPAGIADSCSPSLPSARTLNWKCPLLPSPQGRALFENDHFCSLLGLSIHKLVKWFWGFPTSIQSSPCYSRARLGQILKLSVPMPIKAPRAQFTRHAISVVSVVIESWV